ncbi:hypothetical protein J6590_065130 [Homalodisca vitripennis]|nr:hypothetical protein J6590_065130 [Homalodisca vitripennis]
MITCIQFMEDEVINKLNTSKEPGLDNILPSILKLSSSILVQSLRAFFNGSLLKTGGRSKEVLKNSSYQISFAKPDHVISLKDSTFQESMNITAPFNTMPKYATVQLSAQLLAAGKRCIRQLMFGVTDFPIQ